MGNSTDSVVYIFKEKLYTVTEVSLIIAGVFGVFILLAICRHRIAHCLSPTITQPTVTQRPLIQTSV